MDAPCAAEKGGCAVRGSNRTESDVPRGQRKLPARLSQPAPAVLCAQAQRDGTQVRSERPWEGTGTEGPGGRTYVSLRSLSCHLRC